VFQALLDSKPPAGSVFAFFWDPDLVDECYRLGVGASIEAKLGGRINPRISARRWRSPPRSSA